MRISIIGKRVTALGNGTISPSEIANILLAAVDPSTEGLLHALHLAHSESDDDEIDVHEFKGAIMKMNRMLEKEIAVLKTQMYITQDQTKVYYILMNDHFIGQRNCSRVYPIAP